MFPTGQSGEMAMKNHQQPVGGEIRQPDFTSILTFECKGESLLSRSVARRHTKSLVYFLSIAF
jgi:hypothetical protein